MMIRVCKTDEEIRALALLAKQIWHEYFITLISKEQIEYMVTKFQSYEALYKAINEEHYTYFLAYEEQTLIGFCGVKPDKSRLFLSKLYIQKDNRGKGYASLLLKKAIDYGNALHLNAIYLSCNKHNHHSLAIYKQKGFLQIDAVQTDIGQGFIMDDYILQLDL